MTREVLITVKTGGLLGEYLPAGGRRNRAEVLVAVGATPLDVMKQLGFPLDEVYLVSLNGQVVPVAERNNQGLSANDTLAIMPPLKGG